MPLVIAPLGVLLVGLFLYAYLSSHSMTVRPQLDATADRKVSFLKTASFLYKASGLKWVLHVTKVTQAITSRFAVNHFPALTRWFGGHTARVQAQAREFSHISNDTADSLSYLRHHTMPRAINSKVAPVRKVATHADHAAGRALGRVRTEEKARRRSISLTNKRLGALAGLLLGADVFVFGRHALTHHRHHVRDIPRMRDRDIPRLKARDRVHDRELARTRSRLKRLEKALGLGLLAGIVYRVLTRVAPWLFCRNWKVLGRAICGMNPNALANLIGLLLGVFVLSDLRRSARLAEDALDLVTGLVWDAAQIGDRPSGRFTID
jgi:hypothetical protein